jgi:hypothetical protein
MEKNKFKRAWIWLWYNDITRLCVMIGLPTIALLFAVGLIFGFGEYLRFVAMVHYVIMFGWMMLDNDYSNLRRIGLNEHRQALTK